MAKADAAVAAGLWCGPHTLLFKIAAEAAPEVGAMSRGLEAIRPKFRVAPARMEKGAQLVSPDLIDDLKAAPVLN